MIQRVQSIYLLLASLMAVFTFFLPYAHFYGGDVKVAEYAMFGVFNVQSDILESPGVFSFPAWALGALTVVMPLVAIFLYKNRPLQYRIARLSYMVNLVYVVYLFFAIDRILATIFEAELRTLYHVGFYMPVAAVVMSFLAVRGIKKDEKLVKSLDRIR